MAVLSFLYPLLRSPVFKYGLIALGCWIIWSYVEGSIKKQAALEIERSLLENHLEAQKLLRQADRKALEAEQAALKKGQASSEQIRKITDEAAAKTNSEGPSVGPPARTSDPVRALIRGLRELDKAGTPNSSAESPATN